MIHLLTVLGSIICAFLLSADARAQVDIFQKSRAVVAFEWSTQGPELRKSSIPRMKGAPQFHELYLQGLLLSQTPYKPELPYKSFIVEGDAQEIQVVMKNKKVQLYKGVTPAPAAKWPCRCEGEKPDWQFRKSYYQPSRQRPWVKVSSLGDYRGRPLSKVTFYPVKTQDVQTLEVLRSVDVEIRGARLWSWERATQGPAERSSYLLVTPAKFKKALSVFAEQKTRDGHEVLWLDYKDQTPEHLTQQIRGLYEKNAFDFAVIAGHNQDVPTHLVRTSADPQTPTDRLYFSMGPQGDLIPDVFYARLVAQDAQGMGDLVEKVLRSQHSNGRSVAFEGMGLASDEGMNPSDEEYIQQMLAPLERELGWNTRSYFQRRRSDGPEAIREGFAQGARWLNYIGHGVGPAWTSIAGGEFNLEDVAQIQAHDVLPVVIDVACQNGRMSLDGRLGVHLMNHHDSQKGAGAQAYYGGNVDISWHPPAVMAVGIGKARAHEDFIHLGQVLWAGQMHLLETYEDLPAAAENLNWYHLQGDPGAPLPR